MMEIITRENAAATKQIKSLILKSTDMPLTVQYGETVYVLVLTKSGKLLLQKPLQ